MMKTEEACRRFKVGSRKHNAPEYNFAKIEAVAFYDALFHGYILSSTAVPDTQANPFVLPVIPGRKKAQALDYWRKVLVLK